VAQQLKAVRGKRGDFDLAATDIDAEAEGHGDESWDWSREMGLPSIRASGNADFEHGPILVAQVREPVRPSFLCALASGSQSAVRVLFRCC